MTKYYLNDIYWVINKENPIRVVPIIFNKNQTKFVNLLTSHVHSIPEKELNKAKQIYDCKELKSTNEIFEDTAIYGQGYCLPLGLQLRLLNASGNTEIKNVVRRYTANKLVDKDFIKKLRDKIFDRCLKALNDKAKKQQKEADKKLKENQKKTKKEANRNSYINF